MKRQLRWAGLSRTRAKVDQLITIDDFDSFIGIREFPPSTIIVEVLNAVSNLDEREELEPFIRSILFDTSGTPHGPAELVDILTHKLKVKKESGLAAFILKGKSFSTVRPKHVAHQIYRLEKISGLRYAVFGATGIILDEAREQFCSTAERLNCKYAIFDSMDIARLLVGYGFLCPRDGQRIAAGRCRCGYSPKKRILNVLQIDTLKALTQTHELGQRAGLVVLPPGSGKTRIAAQDSKSINATSVLYVAHTHEILDVAISEFEAVFGKENVTHHSKTSLAKLNRVNITTIQLIRRYLNEISQNDFDYVVIDEFHHAAAKSYRQLIEKTSPKFLLGLTATPFRGDRQDIRELCENNTIVNYELRMGIETGVLSPYHYFGCFDNIDYSKIPQQYAKYSIEDLETALIIPERHEAIVRKWRELADGKPTLAFCCSHRHAKLVSQAFKQNGIPSDIYLSTTNRTKREELIANLQLGKIKILCIVDILNEGADFPFVECLLFLRPTESRRIFYQQLGRGLRRYVGKSHCTVIDLIGNFKNAYLIPEYQGLLPFSDEEALKIFSKVRNTKEILNLPIGCEVHFEDRVIDIFAEQAFDPKHATRQNIRGILYYQYLKLAKRLQRKPTRTDVDRNLLLNSDFYKNVFGNWQEFEKLANEGVKSILQDLPP